MNKTIPIFKYPEFKETFRELFDKLLNESGRGAILVGTSYVEDSLEKFILKILPNNQKKYTSRLLNYPGPLSSFSAKIELTFAFRLISEKNYNALNYLRKIRNEAAHSSKEFCLTKTELDKIFDLGEGFTTMIHDSSFNMMMNMKEKSIKAFISEDGMDEEEINTIFSSSLKDEKVISALENQLPHWKLIVGLSIICGMLRYNSDQTFAKLNGKETWSVIK